MEKKLTISSDGKTVFSDDAAHLISEFIELMVKFGHIEHKDVVIQDFVFKGKDPYFKQK